MNSELKILIAALQQEHDFLENEIKNCIDDWDFKGAEAFKAPFFHTKEALRILKNVDDPYFEEIEYVKKKIDYLVAYSWEDEPLVPFMGETISYKEKLAYLENAKKPEHYDSDELIKCFERMVDGALAQFAIEIDEISVMITVSKVAGDLKMEIRQTNDYSFVDATGYRGITRLKVMGFIVSEDHAVITITDFGVKKIQWMITLLSRMAYEVYGLYGDKKAKIRLDI